MLSARLPAPEAPAIRCNGVVIPANYIPWQSAPSRARNPPKKRPTPSCPRFSQTARLYTTLQQLRMPKRHNLERINKFSHTEHRLSRALTHTRERTSSCLPCNIVTLQVSSPTFAQLTKMSMNGTVSQDVCTTTRTTTKMTRAINSSTTHNIYRLMRLATAKRDRRAPHLGANNVVRVPSPALLRKCFFD